MSYIPSTGTGSEGLQPQVHGYVSVRKLTESQGARSTYYEASDRTGQYRRPSRSDRPPVQAPPGMGVTPTSLTAELEHAQRLLRTCEATADELVDASDPVDAALLGSLLLNTLEELWRHRFSREADWSEAINILQITLAGIEFETLERDKRLTLAKIFARGRLLRTVCRSDLDQVLGLLSKGGFDIWRGLELGPEDRT